MPYVIPDQPIAGLEEGIWSPEFNGAEFKVAYAGNVRFARIKDRIEKPHRRQIEKGTVDPKDQRSWMIQSLAEGILMDWRGVTNSSGQEVPYSVKAGIAALTNDEELRDFVMTFSMDLANYKAQEAETEGKF